MRRHTKRTPKQDLKWSSKKPLTQGRFWWTSQGDKAPKLVYVEKQSLGLYVLGAGWLPYQSGQWAGPLGEGDAAAKN
jgi:hypothetical protein